jgi:hypothetical protein
MSCEVTGEPAILQELIQRLVTEPAVVAGQQPARGAVEPRYLGEHPQVAPAAPAEPGRHAARAELARVLQAAAGAADRHAHLRGLGGHLQLAEHLGEQRIGALVVDDEAGVDPDRRSGGRHDEMGVGVAAEPAARFEERHIIGT